MLVVNTSSSMTYIYMNVYANSTTIMKVSQVRLAEIISQKICFLIYGFKKIVYRTKNYFFFDGGTAFEER